MSTCCCHMCKRLKIKIVQRWVNDGSPQLKEHRHPTLDSSCSNWEKPERYSYEILRSSSFHPSYHLLLPSAWFVIFMFDALLQSRRTVIKSWMLCCCLQGCVWFETHTPHLILVSFNGFMGRSDKLGAGLLKCLCGLTTTAFDRILAQLSKEQQSSGGRGRQMEELCLCYLLIMDRSGCAQRLLCNLIWC